MIMNPKTIIIAAAGPSLNDVDLASSGHPVCAVSTAIRAVPKPNVWAFIDPPQGHHDDLGLRIAADQNVLKIARDTPRTRSRLRGFPRVRFMPILAHRERDRFREFMDGRLPLLRGPHKSITFAVQVFAIAGFRRIVFCGCDLQVKPGQPRYAYQGRREHDYAARHLEDHLDKVYATLRAWHQAALRRGAEFLCWSPVEGRSRLLEFMPPYVPEVHHANACDAAAALATQEAA